MVGPMGFGGNFGEIPTAIEVLLQQTWIKDLTSNLQPACQSQLVPRSSQHKESPTTRIIFLATAAGMAKVTIHLVVCTVFASCCPVSWPSTWCNQRGLKDHHTTWWFYEYQMWFFQRWAMQSYKTMASVWWLSRFPQHGNGAGWMCFDSTSTLIGFGCAMHASKVGPPRKPQKQPKSPDVKIARSPGIFQWGFPRFRFWNYCSGHTGPSFSPFQTHSTF